MVSNLKMALKNILLKAIKHQSKGLKEHDGKYVPSCGSK